MGFCDKCGELLFDPRCRCGGKQTATSTATGLGENGPATYSDAYLSGGFRGGVESGFKRMLGQSDDKVEMDCVSCGARLIRSDQVFPGPREAGQNEGKPFCEECYSQRFSKGECAGCHRPVLGMGSLWVKDFRGDLWHKNCYQGSNCFKCNKTIMGQAIALPSNRFAHPQCFKCEICMKPLETYVTKGDSFLCSECGAAHGQRSSSREEIVPKVKQLSSAPPQTFRFHEGKEHCTACNQVLLPSQSVVQHEEKLYHTNCLCCRGCNKPVNGAAVVKDNEIYHQSCAPVSRNLLCASCHQPIHDAFVDHNHQRYHSACFCCISCHKSLAGVPFGELPEGCMCQSCLSGKIAKANPSFSVEVGQRKPGFTVNHQTGLKEIRDGTPKSIPTNLGSNSTCPRCHKAVYMADQIPGPRATQWHRSCLKCVSCNKQLDSYAILTDNYDSYCVACSKK